MKDTARVFYVRTGKAKQNIHLATGHYSHVEDWGVTVPEVTHFWPSLCNVTAKDGEWEVVQRIDEDRVCARCLEQYKKRRGELPPLDENVTIDEPAEVYAQCELF